MKLFTRKAEVQVSANVQTSPPARSPDLPPLFGQDASIAPEPGCGPVVRALIKAKGSNNGGPPFSYGVEIGGGGSTDVFVKGHTSGCPAETRAALLFNDRLLQITVRVPLLAWIFIALIA